MITIIEKLSELKEGMYVYSYTYDTGVFKRKWYITNKRGNER